MRVKDHQGNNFLGGVDLDRLMVLELILPKLRAAGHQLPESETELRNGDFETLYHILLLKAEEAKKELSVTDSSLLDVDSQKEQKCLGGFPACNRNIWQWHVSGADG